MKIKQLYPPALMIVLIVTIASTVYTTYIFLRSVYVLGSLFWIEKIMRFHFVWITLIPFCILVFEFIFIIGLLYRKKWSYSLLIIVIGFGLFYPVGEYFFRGIYYLHEITVEQYLGRYLWLTILFLCALNKKLKTALFVGGGGKLYKSALIALGGSFLILFGSIFFLKTTNKLASIELIEISKIPKTKALPLHYRIDTAQGYSFPVPINSSNESKKLSGGFSLNSFIEKPDDKIFRMVIINDLKDHTRNLYPLLGVHTITEYYRCIQSQDWSLLPLIFRRAYLPEMSKVFIVGEFNGFNLACVHLKREARTSVALVKLEDHDTLKTHEILFGEKTNTATEDFISLMLHIHKNVQQTHSQGRS